MYILTSREQIETEIEKVNEAIENGQITGSKLDTEPVVMLLMLMGMSVVDSIMGMSTTASEDDDTGNNLN